MRTSFEQTGLIALEDSAGIDFAALRADRHARVADEMERQGVDMLAIGRRANVKYLSGHRWLWRSVLTPWGPLCVYVRHGDELHLLGTTWDDGVPIEVPVDRLSPLTWNPQRVVDTLTGVDGVRHATRIGVDGMSPGIAALLSSLAPDAELVDGERLLRGVRAIKLAAEIDCIRIALSLAEGALSAVTTATEPGVRERALKGRFEEEMARYGTTMPAFEGIFCATGRDEPQLRRVPDDRAVGPGELVALSAGVLYAGYEGVASWTVPTGRVNDAQRALHARACGALGRVVDRCRAGAAPSELRDAWVDSGEPLPPVLLAHGVGIGVEPPLVGAAFGASALPPGHDDDPLVAGMVLAVQGYVAERGVGGDLLGCTLVVTDGEPLVLSRTPDLFDESV